MDFSYLFRTFCILHCFLFSCLFAYSGFQHILCYFFFVLCTLCCQFLWIVHLLLPFGILLRLFVLCLVYSMLSVSLDCPFVIALRYSLTFICPVSCVPYVASFSGLSIFSYVYLSCVLCTLCCQFLWIVHFLLRLFVLCLVYSMLSVSLDCPFVIALRYSLTFICPVSCVPYVASFSGLSIFSYVYLSCVLCTLCCQFLWIVHLLLPFGILLRLFVLCLVYSMLSVSLDCPFSLTFICPVSSVPYVVSFSGLSISYCPSVFSYVYLFCVLCTLCCQFLWIVHLLLPFGILLRLFVLCLVYPMLSVSLDCPFVIALRYSLTFICPVSCVPYVVSFFGLSICYCPSVFSYVYLFCVLCTLCCQFLWIVHFLLPFGILLRLFVLCRVYSMLSVSLDCPFVIALRYSLTFIGSVSCVPYVVSFSGLSICYCPSVFSYVYLSCVLCTLCCQFLWIVHLLLPFGILLRLFVLCLVYSILSVCFFGLSICYCPSVFFHVYLSCVLCTLCCQFLWIVHLLLPYGILSRLFVLCLVYPMLSVSLDCPYFIALWYSLTFICSVSCVLYVASFSGLSILSYVYLLCVLCTLCCQFLWIVHVLLRLFALCLVYPMLPVSLDCPFSLTFICPVSCVPYVASFSGLSIFSFVYLPCVLCTLCCQFLWIVHFLLCLFALCLVYPMLPVSLDCPFCLTFICPVSCVLYVVSFSGLSICYCPSIFSNVYLSCVLYTLCCQFLWIVHFLLRLFALCLVYPMLPVSLDCPFSLTFICPVSGIPYVVSFSGLSIFSNVYLSCVLYSLCCQFLWIVHFLLRLFALCLVYPMLPVSLDCPFSLTFICPVSCVPYVASFSGLSIFSYVYLSCVLCTLCCQFLWIVHLLLPFGIL